MSTADLVKLDRWVIETMLHDEIGCGGWSPDVASGNIDFNSSEDCKMKDAADKLPMNVLNNYYSIGIDAYVAYKFHQARDRYYVFLPRYSLHTTLIYFCSFLYHWIFLFCFYQKSRKIPK